MVRGFAARVGIRPDALFGVVTVDTLERTETYHYRDDYGNAAIITKDKYGITLVVNPGYRSTVNAFTNMNEAKRAMRALTGTDWREVKRECQYQC